MRGEPFPRVAARQDVYDAIHRELPRPHTQDLQKLLCRDFLGARLNDATYQKNMDTYSLV
jgi:hypothetical protein